MWIEEIGESLRHVLQMFTQAQAAELARGIRLLGLPLRLLLSWT